MKKLKTLSEFNEDRRKNYKFDKPITHYNGIACPECGKEMYDSNPQLELTSYPPQKHIRCPKCGYSTTRIS